MKKIIFALSISMIAFTSCKEDDDTTTDNTNETKGTVRIYLEHIGSKTAPESTEEGHAHTRLSSDGHGDHTIAFALDDNTFVTAEGDTFGLEKFQYLLTDFSVTANEEEIGLEDAAFYVRQDLDNPSHEIYKVIENIPAGTYSNISFLLGLNDEDNLSDNTTGELSDAYTNGMLWVWDTGYKFAVIEGHVVENGVNKALEKHIAGSAYKREVLIENEFTVDTGSVTELHIQINLSELFEGVSLSSGADHGSSHSKLNTETDHNAIIMDNLKAFLESPHHFMIVEE